MIEEIKNNIRTEIQIIREMQNVLSWVSSSRPYEKEMFLSMERAYTDRLRILNDSVGEMVSSISLVKKIPSSSEKVTLEKVEINNNGKKLVKSNFDPKKHIVSLKVKDKKAYLQSLSINEELLKKLKRHRHVEKEVYVGYKKIKGFAKFSNSLFRDYSENSLEKGKFKNLREDIRKSNMNIMPPTYISMMLTGTIISFFVGILLTVFLIFFELSLVDPYLVMFEGDYLMRVLNFIWVPFAVPLLTWGIFYFYPYTEKQSLGTRINRELPFAAIHMASISGSGIEPTEIFRIIALNKEYKYLAGEIRKLINQINIYGYNLVTSLKNVAEFTPSKKLAELLKGLATALKTGGDLKSFLEKRAENLLLSYRLERENFNKIAETFMDIYISVVIAAPMILLLLLIMISVSGINVGFSPAFMTALIILSVATINIVFIVILGMKQPGY